MAENVCQVKQSKKRRVEEITENSTDKTSVGPELMDLPEPVLIQILSYLDHDFLRSVVFFVSREWKRLAQSRALWSNASLKIKTGHILPWLLKEPIRVCFRDILVTPHLDKFELNLSFTKDNELKSRTLAAVLSSRCKFRSLKLHVDKYSPELVLFFQQHPEIKELQIMDSYEAHKDDEVASGVAAAIGHLIPYLNYLNISFSALPYLQNAGLLLVSPPTPQGKLNVVESSPFPPVSSEPQNLPRPLHLRDDSQIGQPLETYYSDGQLDKPQGLKHLRCTTDVGIYYKYTPQTGSIVDVLSAIIRAHKHTLKSVQIWLPYLDVFLALAECTELEELEVHCDWDGSGICAMLRNMRSTPRRLVVLVPEPLGPRRLSTVLETLSQHASRVEDLKIIFADHGVAPGLFPGFKPLQALLKPRKGTSNSPALRELSIITLGPVGRAQIQELASMAISNGGLSLSKLYLGGCCCSLDDSGEECRDRAVDALKQAAPSLEYTVEHYEYGCGCVGLVPPPQPPQEPPQPPQ